MDHSCCTKDPLFPVWAGGRGSIRKQHTTDMLCAWFQRGGHLPSLAPGLENTRRKRCDSMPSAAITMCLLKELSSFPFRQAGQRAPASCQQSVLSPFSLALLP